MTNETLQQFLNLGYDIINTVQLSISGMATNSIPNEAGTAAIFVMPIPSTGDENAFIGINTVDHTTGFPLFQKISFWDGAAVRPLYTPMSLFIKTTVPENFALYSPTGCTVAVLYLKLRQL